MRASLPAVSLRQAPADLILRTSAVLDGRGAVLRGVNIRIRGDRIVALERAAPPHGVEYDLRGLTVMPGWIDTHVHISWHFDRSGRLAGSGEPPQQAMLAASANAWATLQGGFTTVQNSPNEPQKLVVCSKCSSYNRIWSIEEMVS